MGCAYDTCRLAMMFLTNLASSIVKLVDISFSNHVQLLSQRRAGPNLVDLVSLNLLTNLLQRPYTTLYLCPYSTQ